MSVSLHDRTKTFETTITKLAIGIVHHFMSHDYAFNIRSKVTESQSAKHIAPNCHLTSSGHWCWSGGRGILTELSLCYSIV